MSAPTAELTQIQETVQWLHTTYPHTIDIAVVLGSGLGDLVESLSIRTEIPYEDIPHFPKSTVEGHAGALVVGQLPNGKHVAFLKGRFHYYEGHPMASVVYPIRAMYGVGVKTLIVTNAAGGINPAFKPGSLMAITDHINLLGTNPLIGPNYAELGPRFPDMSQAYHPDLLALAFEKAQALNIPLQKGVYAAMTGPSYETPAEIRMLRTLGADAVGMSTVPEVIAANHMAMRVLGISCVTNAAAGVNPGHVLSHTEVLEAAQSAKANFERLIRGVLDAL